MSKLVVLFLAFLSLISISSSAKAKNYIIFDGNSLVAGYPSDAYNLEANHTFPDGTDFPSLVIRQLGDTWTGNNVAICGRALDAPPPENTKYTDLATQLGQFGDHVLVHIKGAYARGAAHVIVVNGGEPGNMLYIWRVKKGESSVAAQNAAYAAIKSYAGLVHKAGAIFIDITMPARMDTGSDDQNLRADIEAVNTRIRNDCVKDKICDAVVPLDTDPRMKNIRDARYYFDGAHFNAAGYRIWAEYTLKGIREVAQRW